MSKSPSNPNDQWLIKSANRVMGPFKLIEVITGLQLKHFTVMDEIAAPFGRWILVRDEQALQSAVKDIRNRSDTFENTATLTHTLTASMSMSMNEAGSLDAPPPFPGSLDPRLLKDPKLQSQVKKRSSNFILGIAVAVVLAVGGAYLFMSKKKVKDASQDLFAQAMQFKAQGFYDNEFALLTKLKSSDKGNPQIDLEIGIYQISVQNQNGAGRKTLEKILSQLDAKEGLADANTAIALSYMNENDGKNAMDAINKALAADPNFLQAKINKAILAFKQGNLDGAETGFDEVSNQTNNGVIVLGQAIVSLEKSRTGGAPKLFGDVLVNSIDEYLKNNFEYQQEAYLLRAYNYFRSGKAAQLRQDAILKLLNSDLESGQGHRFDLLVDRSILNWKNLEDYCKSTIELNPRDVVNRSFMAYCHFKAGNLNEAKTLILQTEAEAPRHPHVAAIKAYIMKAMGEDAIARASMGIALGQSDILNALLMRSKYCEADQNLACMQEALDKISLTTTQSLPYYVGMAKLYKKRGDRKSALDWLARGQKLSQTYLPFWELKNSL